MPRDPLPLSDAMIEVVARRFRMLGEPLRLRILQSLEHGERSVGEMVDLLDANQSNIYKHLQALYDADLVSRRRDGNSIYYGIADPMIFQLCELVCRGVRDEARNRLAAMAGPATAASSKTRRAS